MARLLKTSLLVASTARVFALRTGDDEATIAEDDLANVTETAKKDILAKFDDDFWFGLATAPAHVEVAYKNDPWVKFAKDGHVAAYDKPAYKVGPDERLRFLEEPEVDIDLAAKTGSKVFRMGVEWGRLAPKHPTNASCPDKPCIGVQEADPKEKMRGKAALKRYKEICQMVKKKGMKVMMTLFHHAIPAWAAAEGGWTNNKTVDYFLGYAKDVAKELGDVVDYWVTFNEPHVFVLLSECAGMWPPGPKKSLADSSYCLAGALPGTDPMKAGGYTRAMGHIQKSHMDFYKWAHGADSSLKNAEVGVAHNVANNEADGIINMPTTAITESLFKFAFIDAIKGHLDWMGLNYYGTELLSGAGPKIMAPDVAVDKQREYSESGRQVDPDGFYSTLMQFHERYPIGSKNVSFNKYIITENGISDGTDILRPAYIVEHLLALREAQRQGMNIAGYVHWTISDNWEWADGYCPKFGLVGVDRNSADLKRSERPSYKVYTDIVKANAVSQGQRSDAWEQVRQAALSRKNRTFCRHEDGVQGLDSPVPRPMALNDWRFTMLSQAEKGCSFSPWAAGDGSVSVSKNGTCNFLPVAEAESTWVLNLYKTKRCPGKPEPEKIEQGFLCSAFGSPASSGGKDEVDWASPCCCKAGTCAPMKKTEALHSVPFYTRSCPSGFEGGSAKEDKAKCDKK